MTTQRRPTQTLQSMLALEEKLGFEDRAVAGGLDGFLRKVLKDGEQEQFFKRIVAALPQDGYASLTPGERGKWAADVRASLHPGAAPRRSKRSDKSRTGRTNTQPADNEQDESRQNLDKSGQIRTPKRTKSSRRRPPATFDDENPLARDVSVLGRIPPISRKAMTSIHPHGGGEGRSSGGRHPVTPWGVPTKGHKTRRTKRTSAMIVRRRNRRR